MCGCRRHFKGSHTVEAFPHRSGRRTEARDVPITATHVAIIGPGRDDHLSRAFPLPFCHPTEFTSLLRGGHRVAVMISCLVF
jgi:hypothetical protein